MPSIQQLTSGSGDQFMGSDRAAFFNRIDAMIWSGDFKQAVKLLSQARSRKNAAPVEVGFAEFYIGEAGHFQWDFESSMSGYENAIKAFREAGAETAELMTQFRISDIVIDMAQSKLKPQAVESAMATFEEAFSRAKLLSDPFLVGFGHHYRGVFAYSRGDHASAIASLRQACAIRAACADERYLGSSQLQLARVLADVGDFEEAKALAEEGYASRVRLGLTSATLRALQDLSHVETMAAAAAADSLIGEISPSMPMTRNALLNQLNKLNASFRRPLLKAGRGASMILIS